MTTFRLRPNQAGQWDIFADGTEPPVMTFKTFQDALDHMLDLARAGTCHMQVVLEFLPQVAAPHAGKGFFMSPVRPL